ncbi:MAG: sigma-70 family RNA polymerase sigma factor [Phycisphaerales bacterium]|nr:sigma-70 family RNA polymerase sigma factor [Phycisphaerales bacterium]
MSQWLPSEAQAQAAQEQAVAAAQELTLVLAAKAGDRAAFGKLAQLYQRQCAAVALRLLGNAHDAAELVQDALVKAFRSLDQLQQSERFGPWLMRIVTNLALNFRRSRGRRQAVSLEQPVGDGEDDLRASIAGNRLDAPEQPLTSAELGDAIQRAINRLPEKQRLALIMFAVEKMPQKDVAEVLNCSVEAVKWHVFMARKQLKKSLGEHM